MNPRLLALTSLFCCSASLAMEEDNKKEPQTNSGVAHFASKLLWPKTYVCDPDNNKRYVEYKEKIESTTVEKLRTDAKFWEDHKRMTERIIKLMGVVATAIENRDLDTLTLLYSYNDELPDPLDLVRKALDEGKIKISRALKEDIAKK